MTDYFLAWAEHLWVLSFWHSSSIAFLFYLPQIVKLIKTPGLIKDFSLLTWGAFTFLSFNNCIHAFFVIENYKQAGFNFIYFLLNGAIFVTVFLKREKSPK